ncbi:hypothetical protein ACO0RG_004737 [Hanseniaspora osmophila]
MLPSRKSTLIPYQADDPCDSLFRMSMKAGTGPEQVPVIKSPLFLVNLRGFIEESANSRHHGAFSANIVALLHRLENFSYRWTGSFKASLGRSNKFFNLKFKETSHSSICTVVPVEVLDQIVFEISEKQRALLRFSKINGNTEIVTNSKRAARMLFSLVEKNYKDKELPLSFWKKLCNLACSVDEVELIVKLTNDSSLQTIKQDYIEMAIYRTKKDWLKFVAKFHQLEKSFLDEIVYNELFGSLYFDSLERLMKAGIHEKDCIDIYNRCLKRLGLQGQFKLLHVSETHGLTKMNAHIQASLSSLTGYLKDYSESIQDYLHELQNMNVELDFCKNPDLLNELEFLTVKFPTFEKASSYCSFTDQVFAQVTNPTLRLLYAHFLLKNISSTKSFVDFSFIIKDISKRLFSTERHFPKLSDFNVLSSLVNSQNDVFYSIFENLSRNRDCQLTTYRIYQYLKKNMVRDFTAKDYYCLIKANLQGDSFLAAYYYIGELILNLGASFLDDNKKWSLPHKIEKDLIEKGLINFFGDTEIESVLYQVGKQFEKVQRPISREELLRIMYVPDVIDSLSMKEFVFQGKACARMLPWYHEQRDMNKLESVAYLIES